jgi:3,4-dihydroxy 2-butanone 4-phosphate synthase / GTP cyclohydrolase II
MTSQPVPAPDRSPLHRIARTVLPTAEGRFDVHAYVDPATGTDYLALAMGDVGGGRSSAIPGGLGLAGPPPLVRVHSECLTGDALGSLRCDCGDQLRAARRAIAAEGRGVVVYLRGHEGRGIGLGAKLRAYALQDQGLDTVDANLVLGLGVDLRDYQPAAWVLHELGVHTIRLLSSNPAKETELRRHGVEVAERVVLPVPTRAENLRYLQTKQVRMGHSAAVTTADVWAELTAGRVPLDLGDGDAAALVDRYAPIVCAGPRLVLGQLGQSLDGFIAARTGDAVFVTGEQDREHLHRLRALVDAVVVGVGTVVADDCQLTVRAVEGASPVRVVLDPAGRAPRTAKVLNDPCARTLWCIARHAPSPGPVAGHVEVVPLPVIDGRFSPQVVLEALGRRGLHRVLVEGGGVTVSGFLAARALDRLYITTAPLLIGDGVPGLRFPGADRLSDALRVPARRFDLGPDVCVELDLSGRLGRDLVAVRPTRAQQDDGAGQD